MLLINVSSEARFLLVTYAVAYEYFSAFCALVMVKTSEVAKRDLNSIVVTYQSFIYERDFMLKLIKC